MPILSIPDAHARIITYAIAHGSTLPEITQAELAKYHPSPVDRVARMAEALYAVASNLEVDGLALSADLASFCVANQLHTIGQTERGSQIAVVVKRATTYVAQATDPVPQAQFQVPPPT